MHVHLDLVGGLAGDMFLAAAIDAGVVDVPKLEAALRTLGLGDGIVIEVEQARRGAIAGTRVWFDGWDPAADSDHRHLTTIERLIGDSALPESVKTGAVALFRTLGAAESKIHGIPMERVHFHEVGAVDSILDFVSAAWIIDSLGATWSVGQIPTGRGTIVTAHGEIPVPAPATAELLSGMPLAQRDVEGELVTPTGAAILATLAPSPLREEGTLSSVGYGCGTKDFAGISNVVRMMIFQQDVATSPWIEDEIVLLETDIDDMSPEVLADVVERRLPELGALDVTRMPVHMKKGRVGVRVTVLCGRDATDGIVECLLRETSTLGVREQLVRRRKLRRRSDRVETKWGSVDVKVAMWGDETLRVTPEYESCVAIARREGVPLEDVYRAVLATPLSST